MEVKRKIEDISTHSGKLRCERKASIRNCLKESVNVINSCWTSDKSLNSGQLSIKLSALSKQYRFETGRQAIPMHNVHLLRWYSCT
jgi:hypothetical protein